MKEKYATHAWGVEIPVTVSARSFAALTTPWAWLAFFCARTDPVTETSRAGRHHKPMSATSIPAAEPAATSPDTRRKIDEAARLTALTGGRLEVYHDNGRYCAPSPSTGHRYGAIVTGEDSCIDLDDREPATLQEQLVSELRRISRLYSQLADRIEQENVTQ